MQGSLTLMTFFSRFEYWILAVKSVVTHPFIGVGHMQFKTLSLDYVQDTSNLAHLDMAKVAVADNMYLTTAMERGCCWGFSHY